MRILIVVAPYYYANRRAIRTELLGILYLASALRLRGHDVSILDPTIEEPKKVGNQYYYGISAEEISKNILNYNPDVVGISCSYAHSHQEGYKIACLAKDISKEIVTVMGGMFATVYNDKILQNCDAIDYVLIGESEQSMPELLSALSSHAQGTDLSKIDGLVYRKGGLISKNEKKCFISNLDSIPFPARDLVDIKKYMGSGSVLYGLGGRPTSALLTSRACPYGCTFCNNFLSQGSRWRPRSAENVLCEIEEIVNKYRAEHVFIFDDNFTFDTERAKKICSGIVQKGYRFKWNTPNGISVKRLDLETMRLMKRAGCANVCVGIESGSEYIRNQIIKKNISNEEIIKAVEYCNSAKLPVGGFIIVGFPGETEQHFKETLNFIKHLKLSFINIAFAIPLPGTKLYQSLLEKGIIEDGYISERDNFSYPKFATNDFSKADLIRRRKELFSKFFISHIPKLFEEFFGGRLNWIGKDMLIRALLEKVMN